MVIFEHIRIEIESKPFYKFEDKSDWLFFFAENIFFKDWDLEEDILCPNRDLYCFIRYIIIEVTLNSIFHI